MRQPLLVHVSLLLVAGFLVPLGCARYATVRQIDGTELVAEVTRSDHDVIQLRTSDGSLHHVWRDAVREVAHPGVALEITGAGLMVVGGGAIAFGAALAAAEAMAQAFVAGLFQQSPGPNSPSTESTVLALSGTAGVILGAVLLYQGHHNNVQSRIAWHFPTSPPLPLPLAPSRTDAIHADSP